MTQLEYARNNRLTDLMKGIAERECVPAKLLIRRIQEGSVVIPFNNSHRVKKPCGIGKGLFTKINANIGTSTDRSRVSDELKKLKVALNYGSDTVMDLSVGGDLEKMLEAILKYSPVPVGTVPIYEIAVRAQKSRGNLLEFNADEIMDILESQAKKGVDFFTIHAGVTRRNVAILKKHKRTLGIVSRGGAILAGWMNYTKKENPFYEYFDRILDIAYKYDVTISLGDGIRPGSILDSTDLAQISELKTLGKLVLRARRRNVQVIVEGPGHVPLNEIPRNISLEKKICQEAPFYVLGPLVTDVGAGYDHISAAIGGALAASLGADFLCYVTPSEHLRHPSLENVREGVVASKIAAHAADLVKRPRLARNWDSAISQARKKRDWKKQMELAVDPEKAKSYRSASKPRVKDACTMCGRYCSIKLVEECL